MSKVIMNTPSKSQIEDAKKYGVDLVEVLSKECANVTNSIEYTKIVKVTNKPIIETKDGVIYDTRYFNEEGNEIKPVIGEKYNIFGKYIKEYPFV